MLTLAIFLPTITALIAILIPGSKKNAVRATCLLGSILTFAITVMITVDYMTVDPADSASRRLEAVFNREYEAGLANAVDHTVSQSDLTEEQLAWLEAGDSYSAHANVFRVDDISENSWNRLLFVRTVREAVEAGRPYSSVNTAAAASLAEGDTWLSEADYLELRELHLALQAEQGKLIDFVEYAPWISTFRINYFLGVDGLSVPLVFLTAFLVILCLIYSWYVQKGAKSFYILFLLMETGLIGVFCALDFFLFYVFWEVVLLPMYFLIGVWGGPRRVYAAIKFFIYTLVGSVLMLIAMLVLYTTVEPFSFNMLTLMVTAPKLAYTTQMWLFLAVFIGFAIKVPVFPFHTWLPDAHVEAPTAGSMILAGVLLKMGGYGFFRIAYPLLPGAATSTTMVWMVGTLGAINIVYGALAAMAQRDFKSLVAYSSISHMGYILLGLAAGTVAGYTGGVLQMFNHGISSAMMFCLVGCIQNRVHHRNLDDMGGFGLQMPYFTALAIVAFFAALGLPGLNGFVSEALTFLGCFEQGADIHRTLVYISMAGIVLTAGYILWTIQRVFLGTTPEKYSKEPDVNLRESISLIPLGILCIVLGVFPQILIYFMDPSISTIHAVVTSVTP